jgi:hypothetical protein
MTCPRTQTIQPARPARHSAPWMTTLVLPLLLLLGCREATALPSFASQTGMPCSRCHTLSFGPALTAYGRQFKLNGYTWGEGDFTMPLALMVQGGFSHVAQRLPDPPAPHYSTNDNLSVDQVSMFYGGRLTENAGAFVQVTYTGADRHTSWDNTDLRYARTISLAGTDAVVGLSINNNPTVQDLWNSTPAWGYPYIASPLVPGPAAGPIISGGLAQLVLGATFYTMIHDTLYLEAGGYRGLSNRWLGNLGPGADSNPHVKGIAPYWRAALQWNRNDTHYFSVGTFGIDVKLQPDPTVPDTDRYTDLGVDATYQYTDDDDRAVTVNASLIHEKQKLEATFNAGGSASANDHLDVASVDASFVFRQTWSAGLGLFDTRGDTDQTLYSPGPLTGSNSGSPDSRGYTVQLEYVPFGKMNSFGRPWLNVRIGVQYTGYLRFNGGASDYDGSGRSASQNNSLFVFYWMIF